MRWQKSLTLRPHLKDSALAAVRYDTLGLELPHRVPDQAIQCLVVVRIGWGHSTYRHAFEFAARAGVKELVPFHHDPSHDDETLDRLLGDAVQRFKPKYVVSEGCEGAVFEVGPKS